MRRPTACLLVLALLPAAAAPANGPQRFAYPEARRADQVDVFHGVPVADPYRWLEDGDSSETRAWIEAQNRLSSAYLEGAPGREALRRRLTELWDYERYTPPAVRAGRYFFTRNEGLQNQAVLYVADGLAGAPRAILDPNAFSADGTIAMTSWLPSEDATLVAYGIASGGSDWEEWRVREVATGRDLPDRIEWVKFVPVSWTRDGKGFFYGRFPAPAAGEALAAVNYDHKLYYHRLGTPQSADPLVYERRDHKEWEFDGTVTEDGRYLVIHVVKGTETKNGVFYKDLATPEAPVVELLTAFDATYWFLGNDGPVFWFQTNLDAPRGRVIAIDTRTPERARWRELVPQGEDTLDSARVVRDSFLVHYLHDAHSRAARFDLAGRPLGELALPGLGTARSFTGRRADRESFFTFTSFTTPPTVYRIALDKGAVEVFRQPKIAFTPGDYEIRQVFFTSKDGTRVPMFITHRKGLARDGRNPTYLTGYGGFKIPITPSFSVQYLVWMEMGGVLAIPNLRGGGEYGDAWHEAGKKLNKQNVFDDAYAAAEWLIANRYTTRERLAIAGRSNGGLLTGAAVTQRPDLFGAAVVAVGVLDMLRFHKFTIGWGWVSDYGSPDDPREFRALHAYSPYHNVKPGTAYPPTLITTADHDDRVFPGHSFKFAAALQHAQAAPAPILARIETRAGHGAGKPTSKQIEQATDELSFLVRALGVTPGVTASRTRPLEQKLAVER